MDLAVPELGYLIVSVKSCGSAEVQRLAQGPVKGRNWVGSSRSLFLVVGLGPWTRPSNRKPFFSRPELKQEHPLNLSISISGGKETNKDSLSNGE